MHVGGGPSGADGFIANGSHHVLERYKNGGHTAYYPDDRDDVVSVIAQGVRSLPKISRDEWELKINRYTRAKIAAKKLVSLLLG
jgi:hypothetical protein